MRTKHWSHPLEDSPGVAPEIEPLGPPIRDEPIKLKPQRADFPIGKIGTSDAALDNFLDAVMAFDERERIILYRDPTTDSLQPFFLRFPPSYGVAMMSGAARAKRSWAFMRALAPKNVKRISKKKEPHSKK